MGREKRRGEASEERDRALDILTYPVSGCTESKDALYLCALILIMVSHGPMNNRINQIRKSSFSSLLKEQKRSTRRDLSKNLVNSEKMDIFCSLSEIGSWQKKESMSSILARVPQRNLISGIYSKTFIIRNWLT